MRKRIKCPNCGSLVRLDKLYFGVKIVTINNGIPSHGGVACQKCRRK